MPLERTQTRLDALALSNEGRLYTDEASSSYFVGSELGDTVKAAQPQISTAVSELRADGDFDLGTGASGPADTTPMVLTAAGQARFEDWSQ